MSEPTREDVKRQLTEHEQRILAEDAQESRPATMFARDEFSHNPKPVCPHCSYVFPDPTDMGMTIEQECHDVTCDRCEQELTVIRHVSVTYSTGIIER